MNSDKPEVYSSHNHFQRHFATIPWRELTRSVESLPAFNNVLDLGCGSGEVTRNLAAFLAALQRNGPRLVIGIDSSPEMIDFCQNNHQVSSAHGIVSKSGFASTNDSALSPITTFDFRVAAFDQLFPEDWKWSSTFDLVTSHLALQFASDLTPVFENISLTLRREGQFLLMFAAEAPEQFIIAGQRTALKWPRYVPANVMDNFTPVTCQLKGEDKKFDPLVKIKEIISAAGLELHSCKFERELYVFPNLVELRGILEALYPHVRYVPSEMKEELVDELLEEYGKACLWLEKCGEKKATWQGELLVVHGEKP